MTDRLFVYGSLAPGRSNAHVLDGVRGSWEPAQVHGRLTARGWGAGQGYPGLVPDPHLPPVAGMLLTSDDLPAHWDRLDEFEGVDYRRVQVDAHRADGSVVAAWVYTVDDGTSSTATASSS